MSTDRQAEHGQGLGVQEAACRAWCRTHRRRIVAVDVDEGVSGSAAALEQRVALAAALGRVRGGVAELLVYRLDRLARDMVLQEQLLADISRAGGRLRSTSPVEDAHLVDDPDDPTRALVRQVLGAVAAYDRAMVTLRMRLGRDRKRAAGGYAGGQPPYGHTARGGALVPDRDLAARVDLIRRRRRAGRSLRDIAAELERLDGRPWHPQQVKRVLDRWQRRAP